MRLDGNTIFFKDDQEFYDFAVNKRDIFSRTDTGILYHDWDFTELYEKNLADGRQFVIEDPESQVVKHQCAVFRTVCKPVENVSGPKPEEPTEKKKPTRKKKS